LPDHPDVARPPLLDQVNQVNLRPIFIGDGFGVSSAERCAAIHEISYESNNEEWASSGLC
jgi:hypothetical protein